MVEHFYAAAAPARNMDHVPLGRAPRTVRQAVSRRKLPVLTRSLSPRAVTSRLLGVCDVDGRATVDDMVRAIPDHPRPLLAIMSLIDEGWLEMDLASAFEASTEVRRSTPR